MYPLQMKDTVAFFCPLRRSPAREAHRRGTVPISSLSNAPKQMLHTRSIVSSALAPHRRANLSQQKPEKKRPPAKARHEDDCTGRPQDATPVRFNLIDFAAR